MVEDTCFSSPGKLSLEERTRPGPDIQAGVVGALVAALMAGEAEGDG